jgi:hypothetical protein
MSIYKNITTTGTHVLIAKKGYVGGSISKVSISNNSIEDAAVSVFLDDDNSNLHYHINSVVIPGNVALVLNENLAFNSTVYSLKLANTGTSPSLSVIIS